MDFLRHFLLDYLLDFLLEIEGRKLQQAYRLLQLGRHGQTLAQLKL